MSLSGSRHLPRLEREFYCGPAVVHWTLTVRPATPGWLDDQFHHEFRDLLLHACVRKRLFCPAYCLMPDHLHLMWMGLASDSDQRNGMKFFRLHLNRLLAGDSLQRTESAMPSRAGSKGRERWILQTEPYDHVLREEERKRNTFAKVCFYILANPVRGELVKREQDWPYEGAVVPGYPDLHPFQEGFWELFWKLYSAQRVPGADVAR
jgi:putative transposase